MNKFPLEPSYAKALISSYFMKLFLKTCFRMVCSAFLRAKYGAKPSRTKEEEYKKLRRGPKIISWI